MSVKSSEFAIYTLFLHFSNSSRLFLLQVISVFIIISCPQTLAFSNHLTGLTKERKLLTNFHMVNNPQITVYVLTMHTLTLLSVDEILLPMYMN